MCCPNTQHLIDAREHGGKVPPVMVASGWSIEFRIVRTKCFGCAAISKLWHCKLCDAHAKRFRRIRLVIPS